MDVEAVRSELPVLERLAYLNAGTNGPLPRRTVEAMRASLAGDLEQGRSSRRYFEAMLERRDPLRAALPGGLEAQPGEAALTTSPAVGRTVALAGCRVGPGGE